MISTAIPAKIARFQGGEMCRTTHWAFGITAYDIPHITPRSGVIDLRTVNREGVTLKPWSVTNKVESIGPKKTEMIMDDWNNPKGSWLPRSVLDLMKESNSGKMFQAHYLMIERLWVHFTGCDSRCLIQPTCLDTEWYSTVLLQVGVPEKTSSWIGPWASLTFGYNILEAAEFVPDIAQAIEKHGFSGIDQLREDMRAEGLMPKAPKLTAWQTERLNRH